MTDEQRVELARLRALRIAAMRGEQVDRYPTAEEHCKAALHAHLSREASK